ncbi:hypothetical protein SASC598O11_008510 [Snodgrassella alvi SCGC AB-598-O11]|nr:hypothetical protein SASC598O11_008510 [Snodgrassella alvi SCGC AB-598-O11]
MIAFRSGLLYLVLAFFTGYTVRIAASLYNKVRFLFKYKQIYIITNEFIS